MEAVYTVLKKIKVVISKGSYRPLCGSRQNSKTGEEYNLDMILMIDISKLTISDVCLSVILL